MDNIETKISGLEPYYYANSSSTDDEKINVEEIREGIIMAAVAISEHATDISKDLERLMEIGASAGKKAFGPYIKLTPSDASKLLKELIGRKIFKSLSPTNILFIEIIKVLQGLSKLGIFNTLEIHLFLTDTKREQRTFKKALQEFSMHVHKLQRAVRQCILLLNGKTSNKSPFAKATLREEFRALFVLFLQLKTVNDSHGNRDTKTMFANLKNHVDVLFYICYEEDFLQYAASSISNYNDIQISVIANPPTKDHCGFYIDSLGVCMHSLTMMHLVLEEDLFEPINAVKSALSSIVSKTGSEEKNALMGLLKSFSEWINQTTGYFSKPLQKLIISLKTDPQTARLVTCFEKIEMREIALPVVYAEMCELLNNFDVIWSEFNTQQLEDQNRLNQVEKNYDAFGIKFKAIRKNARKVGLENGKLGKALKTACDRLETKVFTYNFAFLLNSYFIEPVRSPLLSYSEMSYFGRVMSDMLIHYENLKNVLTKDNNICSAFCIFDLLIHEFSKFSKDLSKTAPTEVETNFINKTESTFFRLSNLILMSQAISSDPMTNIGKIDVAGTLKEIFLWVNSSLEYLTQSQTSATRVVSILKNLRAYLGNFSMVELIPSATYQTFFIHSFITPMSKRDHLESVDLPIMQTHFNCFLTAAPQAEYKKICISLESVARKNLQSCTGHTKSLWRVISQSLSMMGIESDRVYANISIYNGRIQACSDCDALLILLHEWSHAHQKMMDRFKFCWEQVTALDLTEIDLKQFPLKAFFQHASTCYWRIAYLTLSINALLLVNEKPSSSKNRPFNILSDIQNDELFSEDELPVETSLDSNLIQFENDNTYWHDAEPRELLDKLLKGSLEPLNDSETDQSYVYRFSKRQDLLRNANFYLTLIDEGAKMPLDDPELNEFFYERGQLDNLLLLESTEKIGLCSLRVGSSLNKNMHIACSSFEGQPLMHSHDGVLLVKFLAAVNKEWLPMDKLGKIILAQENHLQQTYWYQRGMGHLDGLEAVKASCSDVWRDFVILSCKDSKGQERLSAARMYGRCRKHLHRHGRIERALPQTSKQEENSLLKLKDSLKAFEVQAKWSLECGMCIQRNLRGIDNIVSILELLQRCSTRDLPALAFGVRSAELQISLLSMILQLKICLLEPLPNGELPIFMDTNGVTEGRPLMHTHRVNLLWKVLRPHVATDQHGDMLSLLDESMPLFDGDPRYIYPNKTQLSNTLIKLHDQVYLLQKVLDAALFVAADKKMLRRYVGANGWKKSRFDLKIILQEGITREIKEIEKKNSLAIYLSTAILKLDFVQF